MEIKYGKKQKEHFSNHPIQKVAKKMDLEIQKRTNKKMHGKNVECVHKNRCGDHMSEETSSQDSINTDNAEEYGLEVFETSDGERCFLNPGKDYVYSRDGTFLGTRQEIENGKWKNEKVENKKKSTTRPIKNSTSTTGRKKEYAEEVGVLVEDILLCVDKIETKISIENKRYTRFFYLWAFERGILHVIFVVLYILYEKFVTLYDNLSYIDINGDGLIGKEEFENYRALWKNATLYMFLTRTELCYDWSFPLNTEISLEEMKSYLYGISYMDMFDNFTVGLFLFYGIGSCFEYCYDTKISCISVAIASLVMILTYEFCEHRYLIVMNPGKDIEFDYLHSSKDIFTAFIPSLYAMYYYFKYGDNNYNGNSDMLVPASVKESLSELMKKLQVVSEEVSSLRRELSILAHGVSNDDFHG